MFQGVAVVVSRSVSPAPPSRGTAVIRCRLPDLTSMMTERPSRVTATGKRGPITRRSSMPGASLRVLFVARSSA